MLRKKFGWVAADLSAGRALILASTSLVDPKQTLYVIDADPSDNRILECAVESRSDRIVSGDRHLLTLREYAGIRILRPSEFLASN